MKPLVLLALLLLPLFGGAQSLTVRGVVRAKNGRMPLAGVSVVEKGTSHGTATDAQGRFRLLTTRPAPRLVVSFIGYVSQEVAVGSRKDSLVIFLQDDVRTLSEVVVTGVSAAPEHMSMSGSVSSVTSSSVTGAPARPAGKSLRGRVAGLSVAAAPRAKAEAAAISRADVDAKAKAAGYLKPVGAGTLTAGELNDFGKWTLWSDIAQKDLSEWRQRWHISPLERYAAQLLTEEGFPVVGAAVLLKDDRDSLIWQARTDNTGKCELWNGLFAGKESGKVAALQAVVDGKTYTVGQPTVFHNGINLIRMRRPCQAPSVVDIAFVVDATGSMGDEIQYLQAELQDVIAQVKDSLASSTINLGSVFYRDAGDEYVTRTSKLSPNIQQTIDFIHGQGADGGGDFPEAVDQALATALNELAWSADAKARLLFLILDAPPHESPQVLASLQRSIRRAAANGIRIIPITASGIDKSTEYLMRAMALATNGTYVFLTDDSGVGDAHIKPTTDKFDVERLNTLLVKLVAKYAYTADCRAPKAAASKAGTLSGQYKPGPDTAATRPSRREKSYSWKCYPNPTADVLHVELEEEIKELFVTDVTGKIVLRAAPARHKAVIQLDNFPSGIYFLTFFAGSKWEKAKFLVSR